jgi:hypothetical protein
MILVAIIGATAVAQSTTGTVTGIVTDSANAVVPNVQVVLTNTDTGIKTTSATGEGGGYSFTLVPPGAYRLQSEAAGFRSFSQDFTLQVNQTARIDVKLVVGQISESITVNESVVMIESETSSLGQVISSKQVNDLPLNGRNPFALAALTPGVWPGGSFGVGLGTTRSAAQMAGANNFMADGGIAGSNEVLLDGVPIMVCCQGQPAIIPSVDVTQEFKVQTNSSAAEFGRTSGGILNILTKSGANELHGNAYEFLGNDQLNSANFFTNRSGKAPIPGRDDFRTPLRYNQAGFTLGGPVIIPKLYSGKNKTFFFGGWEGTYVRQYNYVNTNVPPTSIRGGNLSEAPGSVYDPSTTTPDPANAGHYIRTPFSGNAIPVSRINPISVNYLKYFPQPSIAGVVNNYNYIQPISTNDGQGTARIDHNLSDTSRLFGRWSELNDNYTAGDWANGITGNGQKINASTFVIDYVKSPTPTTVVDVHYGLAFQRNKVIPFSLGTDATSLGFPSSFEAQQFVQAIPLLGIASYRSIGFDSSRNWSHYTHALGANLSWVRGAHTLKGGWDGRMYVDNQISLDGGAGSFSYNSSFTNGPDPRSVIAGSQAPYDSFAGFLLGVPASGGITYQTSFARQQFYHGLYVQDDWKISSKLTVNIGVRADIDTGFVERYNRQSVFDPTLTSPLAQQTGLNLLGGLAFSGVGGQPAALWKASTHLAPRFGFAYSIDPKTVVRGAYSLFYLPTSQRGYGTSTNSGYSVGTSYLASIDGVTPIGTISNPFPNGTIPVSGSSLGASTLVGSGVGGFTNDLPISYNQQWNLGVQRQLPGSFLVNASYAGSHSVKLPTGFNPNALQFQYYGAAGDQSQVAYLTQMVANPFHNVIKTGSLAASTVQRQSLLAQYPQFTSVGETVDVANSFYNALQISAQKSFSHGLSTLLAYTWSKNLGDANNTVTGFLDMVGTPGYQNNFNRHLEKSVLATDVPHRLVWNANYELPFGKGKRFGSNLNPWINGVVGGWQINGIMTVQSGYPLSFGVQGAQSFAGSRPNFTGTDSNVYSSGSITNRLGGVSGGTGYLNASAFSLPLSFQLGNVPRLTDRVRGPGNQNVDFSMMKYFPIHERLKLQLRAEAFNLLNHPIFSNPNTTVGSASFGIIGGQANAPRAVQAAVKVLW